MMVRTISKSQFKAIKKMNKKTENLLAKRTKELKQLKKAKSKQNKFIRSVKPMARRKKYYKPKQKQAKTKKSMFGNEIKSLATAAAYGAVRGKLSDMAAPLTAKIPGGAVSDEVALGILATVVEKNTTGIVRQFAKNAKLMEAYRVGDYLGTQGLGGLMPQLGGQTQTANAPLIIG